MHLPPSFKGKERAQLLSKRAIANKGITYIFKSSRFDSWNQRSSLLGRREA